MAKWVEDPEIEPFAFNLMDGDFRLGHVAFNTLTRLWGMYVLDWWFGSEERLQEAQRAVEAMFEPLPARPGTAKSLYMEYVASHDTDEVDRQS
jgi:hypothetical protein